jgi:predicted transcriptional regulator
MVREVRPIAVLISLHPQWAEAILSGEKTVEVRRRPPDAPGALMLMYATAPESRVIGRARIASVQRGTPEELWDRFGARSALVRDEFLTYLAGAPSPGVLELVEVAALRPRPLAFPAPQSWMWLDDTNCDHASLVECARTVGRSRPPEVRVSG